MDYPPDQLDNDLIEMQRILIVDDAADTRLTLSLRLQREGFLVSTAKNASDAFNVLESEGLPHLVLLDIMMPGIDGFTFAREIRGLGDVPIIFLSAVTDTETKVEGITQFAEDYVTKPYEFGELAARIRRVLARSMPEQNPDPEFTVDDDLRVNFAQQYAIACSKQVALTPTENRILRALFRNRGRTVSSTSLMSQAWGDPVRHGTIESLWVHIRRLRAKIEVDPDNPHYVTTVRGRGYCLQQQQISDRGLRSERAVG